MNWPPDVLAFVWELVRSYLRPRLKHRVWKDAHAELKTEWTAKVLCPLCAKITDQYVVYVEDDNLLTRRFMASAYTLRALVCTWNLKDAWRTEFTETTPLYAGHTWVNLLMFRDKDVLKGIMHTRRCHPYNGTVVDNPDGMVESMRRCGVEISVCSMKVSEMPEAA